MRRGTRIPPRWRLFPGIFPLFPLPAAADFPRHNTLHDRPEFGVPDRIEAFAHHGPVTPRKRGELSTGHWPDCFARRRGRDLDP